MGRRVPPSLCARCKGYKRLCGLPFCPILERFRAHAATLTRLGSRDVKGSTPPSVIVGERGYPRVPVLYGIPPGVSGSEARLYDDPERWARERRPLRSIVELRSSIVAGVDRFPVERPEKLYEAEISVAAVSEKPVDSEAILEKPPTPSLRFDGMLTPQGPTAPAREIKVESNPRLPRPLEKRIWDDARSTELMIELYREGVPVYTIISALSLGLLGRARSRRLVPTRWAISAVDQTLGDWMLHRVRVMDALGAYEVYHASYLGNRFTIILIPGGYEAEMIEVWHPLTPWTRTAAKPVVYTVTEAPSLRTSVMDGGYLAARLAVAEHLYHRRRQAAVLILREITRDYYAPVGNWHIRETVRRALSRGPVGRFSSLEEALQAAAGYAMAPEAREALTRSRLARRKRSQHRLDRYLGTSLKP